MRTQTQKECASSLAWQLNAIATKNQDVWSQGRELRPVQNLHLEQGSQTQIRCRPPGLTGRPGGPEIETPERGSQSLKSRLKYKASSCQRSRRWCQDRTDWSGGVCADDIRCNSSLQNTASGPFWLPSDCTAAESNKQKFVSYTRKHSNEMMWRVYRVLPMSPSITHRTSKHWDTNTFRVSRQPAASVTRFNQGHHWRSAMCNNTCRVIRECRWNTKPPPLNGEIISWKVCMLERIQRYSFLWPFNTTVKVREGRLVAEHKVRMWHQPVGMVLPPKRTGKRKVSGPNGTEPLFQSKSRKQTSLNILL